MTESEIVKKFKELSDRSQAVGITLQYDGNCFCYYDIPKTKGVLSLDSLSSVALFITGYELGYAIRNEYF